jgi:hypothetical protein
VNASQTDLQASIRELASYPAEPEAAWIAKVRDSPIEVVAGAMLMWMPRSGISAVTGDPMLPRRDAARAILEKRLSDQNREATNRLRTTVGDYQRASTRQTNWMLWLTVVIAVLTAVQIAIAVTGARPTQPAIASVPPSNLAPNVASARLAPVTDRDRGVNLELQEKCGRDAREWFKEFHEGDSVATGPVVTLQNEYSNHYSEKRSRCYALVLQSTSISRGAKPAALLHTMLLADVNENREIGRFFENTSGSVPVKCNLDDHGCSSQQEWQSLAAAYMAQ